MFSCEFSEISKTAGNFIKKETLAQVCSCDFCEISKSTFLTEHLRATPSVTFLSVVGVFHTVYVSLQLKEV